MFAPRNRQNILYLMIAGFVLFAQYGCVFHSVNFPYTGETKKEGTLRVGVGFVFARDVSEIDSDPAGAIPAGEVFIRGYGLPNLQAGYSLVVNDHGVNSTLGVTGLF